MARKQWRCFHCDCVFTNVHEAAIHFGADEAATCACVLPHEQHLVNHIRDLEEQLARYRAEDSDVLRSIYTLQERHQSALRAAEEEGYAKGLRDRPLQEPCKNEGYTKVAADGSCLRCGADQGEVCRRAA